MPDRDLMKTYAVGMFMLSLLDEWSKIERINHVALIYNTITKKHNNFHGQIQDVERGKKKKYSHKCELFIHASALAIVAWEDTLKTTESLKMSVNTVLHNLYRLNSENIKRIYGLDEEPFKLLDKKSQAGITLSSCKTARIMTENITNIIDEKINDVIENIYKKRKA